MRYMFIAPNITPPTFDTVREVTGISFTNLEQYLKKIGQNNVSIRITVKKEAKFFELHVELINFPNLNPFVKIKEQDLRIGLGKAAKKIKSIILNSKKKSFKKNKKIDTTV